MSSVNDAAAVTFSDIEAGVGLLVVGAEEGFVEGSEVTGAREGEVEDGFNVTGPLVGDRLVGKGVTGGLDGLAEMVRMSQIWFHSPWIDHR